MKSYDRHEFAKRLKELRQAKSLTQLQAARQADIPFSFIKNCESGNANRGFGNLIKLAKFYGVTTDFLLLGE